jgi:Cft2 family RNA processing exonuclease
LVISDHADWPGLLEAIKASQAHTIHLVHGNGNWLAQLLLKEGKQVVCHQTSSQKVA